MGEKAKWAPPLGIELKQKNKKLLLSLFGNLVNQVKCTTLLDPSIINQGMSNT